MEDREGESCQQWGERKNLKDAYIFWLFLLPPLPALSPIPTHLLTPCPNFLLGLTHFFYLTSDPLGRNSQDSQPHLSLTSDLRIFSGSNFLYFPPFTTDAKKRKKKKCQNCFFIPHCFLIVLTDLFIYSEEYKRSSSSVDNEGVPWCKSNQLGHLIRKQAGSCWK